MQPLKKLFASFETPVFIVCAIFIVFLLNIFVQGRFFHFGILPRTTVGLIGIIVSPFLHKNAAHLIANCSALLVLMCLLFLNRKYRAEETLLWIWLGSGLGTWLIGRGNTIHIGASAIVYGLIVYLIAAGFWMKGWKPVVAAIAVFIFYAGAIFGLYPQDPKVSWEGHVAGAFVGWLVARLQHA